MEKNNDTQMFDKDKQKAKKSNEGIKVVGAALVGSIDAVGFRIGESG